jgi:hypothetical protein
MIEELLSQFKPYRGLTGPAPSARKLWGEGGRGVWIDDAWGPAVPYGPIDHADGHHNHGYVRIKDDMDAARRIPEAADWPELLQLLEALNASGSPIESVGCEKAFFPVEGQDDVTVNLGAYIDVIFTDVKLNDTPENALSLASHLLQAIEGCEKWWGDVSMVLQRMKLLPGTAAPWCLMLRINNYGRTEAEAREFWAVTVGRLAKAVAALPRDFRWHETNNMLLRGKVE